MSEDIIVIGAGGHAKVCIEILHAMGGRVAYCVGVDDSPKKCVGVPVLNGDENLEKLREEGYRRAFVAIGANGLRKRLAALAQRHGYELINAISPQATVSPSASIGIGVAIMAGVVVNADANIGDLAIVNTASTIDHDCDVGVAVHVAPQCGLAGGVIIGEGSFLGIGSAVIPDVRVGRSVTIGAGSVVISNLEDGVTAVGVPSRVIQGTARIN